MAKTKIIFLGGIFSEKILPVIQKKSKGVIQNAADTLQKCFLKGIKEYNDNITIINLPFIGSYPFLYNDLLINYKNDNFENIHVKNVFFINLKGYKIISRFINTYKQIFTVKDSVFIVYSINISFLLAIYLNNFFKKSNKVILIIPDLPEYMNSRNSFIKRIILNLQDFINRKFFFPKIDCFVLLTEQMGVRLNLDVSKIRVIEGIFSDNVIFDNKIEENKFVVLYTGTLDKRYGILELLNQFSRIEDFETELLICGAGDGLNEIQEFLKKDERIKYLGQLTRNEVLELQRKSSLLVNPRKPEEFTKYSFPSKTMEYFASGTPVLMYRLEGIPEEYFKYCFILDQSDSNSLSNEIQRIKRIPLNQRNELGRKAQRFILENKNPKQQLKKIKFLINENTK